MRVWLPKTNQNMIHTYSIHKSFYASSCFAGFSPVIKKKLGMWKWKTRFFSKSAITFEPQFAYTWNLAHMCQIIYLAIP